MIRVTSIGHAVLATPDLERQLDHYTGVLGLSVVARERDAAFLACPQDHHSVVLRRAAAAAGCATLALQAPRGSLPDLARQLRGQGIAVQKQSDPEPGVPAMLSFEDPDGQSLAVLEEREPVAAAAPGGIRPLRLGHVAFRVRDPQAAVAFYMEALGFRFSDWMGDFFAFLRCGPDHHSVNLLRSAAPRMHHIAFELRDWAHVKEACDSLGRARIPLLWGPGRHTVGSNLFTYHHDRDGQIVELYAELDRMSDEASGAWDPKPWHKQTPLTPRRWEPDPFLSNAWGIPTPQGFRD
jgi:catechol 2,3-dioxygenase-like lactoylglutathione lyase family enzyme